MLRNSNSKLLENQYDVIVVGTGMGGATSGYACARAGLRVLFVEKGRANTSASFHQKYPEQLFPRETAPDQRHRLIMEAAGRCSDFVEDRSYKTPESFVPFIGSGAGGSTALYGAVLERFHACDFQPGKNFFHSNVGSGTNSLPEAWPVSFSQMLPFYRRAEALFGVTPESSRENNKRTAVHEHANGSSACHHSANQQLWRYLEAKGLHPYRLPMALENAAPGGDGQGVLNPRSGRRCAWKTCIQPAVENHGAQLLDECKLVKIEAGKSGVKQIHCLRRGRKIILRTRVLVLAAGALATPCILLSSKSNRFPAGLANGSGMVGRNLMRHFVDLYALSCPDGSISQTGTKELGFNDWYQENGEKFGTVQSFGALPPAEIMVDTLEDEIRSLHPALARGIHLARPLLVHGFRSLLGRKLIIASIFEDRPHFENRVEPGAAPDTPWRLNYRIDPQDQERIERFRNKLLTLFRPWSGRIIKQAENNRRLAHVCGTCKFGDDPRLSVLDKNNCTHELNNLYVVDASFFPSSGGTNPGLTIAANGLRVAEHLVDRLGGKRCEPIMKTVKRFALV